MIFPTRVNGIPCQVKVTYYQPEVPARIFGPPEDCHPSEPEELEFDLLDRRGRPAPWLERYVTPEVEYRLAEEHHVMVQGQLYEAFDA